VNAIIHLLTAKPTPGIYNIGTGKAQTFYQLAKALVINHKKTEDNIKFIEMPNDLNGKYQYFTEAKIEKLIHSGYTKSFMNLEEGVTDYYQNYLSKEDQYL
jgi:ADP-L-glycero-D-manno-heptose 6-epimerase